MNTTINVNIKKPERGRILWVIIRFELHQDKDEQINMYFLTNKA